MAVRRYLLAVILWSSVPLSAGAAPFSFDPVSFAGYANSRQRALGNDVFFKNLVLCTRKGDKGYSCLEGELLKREPGKSGRSFCKLRFVGFHPKTQNINYLIKSCEFRDDRRRLIEQSQQLLRKGLDTLENFSQ
ncbi:hypothetical protein [Cyanobium sp. Morenito 9A2]|uniref:hypothetical protein n=1 Tax=Cyanobium sp. Morenito 9A2 TaxID=2823718 RepID=UPI0020CD6C45|nr:hypothetical protein [Cyanobium sp. Morenito 9A2]MCP9851152.1 hypothetical protein [Cyanobium sp. Morenito 9A2]